MKISVDNYQIYFARYLEGRLNETEVSELFLFVSDHPGLGRDSYTIADSWNDSFGEFYPYKEKLRKDFTDIGEISSDNIDEFCIAALENDLTEDSLEKFSAIMASQAEVHKLYLCYGKTKIIPDTSIKYSSKNTLKKGQRRHLLGVAAKGWISIAALLLIAFLISLFFKGLNTEMKKETLRALMSGNQVSDSDELNENVQIGEGKESDLSHPSLPGNSLKTKPAKSVLAEPQPARFASTLEMLVPIAVNRVEASKLVTIPVISALTGHGEKTGTDKAPAVVTYVRSSLAWLSFDLNIWTLAEAGIKGINQLTEADIELIVKQDDSGKVIAYGLAAENFDFLTPKRKKASL